MTGKNVRIGPMKEISDAGSLFGLDALTSPSLKEHSTSAATKRTRFRTDQVLLQETVDNIAPMEIKASRDFLLDDYHDMNSILSNMVAFLRSFYYYNVDDEVPSAVPEQEDEDNSTTISLAGDGWQFPTGNAPVRPSRVHCIRRATHTHLHYSRFDYRSYTR